MTILMFNTLYYPDKYGGAEKSVQLLAEGLVGLGHKVIVACIAENKTEILNHNGVKIYKFKHNNMYWAFNSNRQNFGSVKKALWHIMNTYFSLNFKKIKPIITQETPDIVHVNNISGFSTGMLAELKKRNIPIVQTLRDFHYLCLKNTLYDHNKQCTSLCTACKLTSRYKLKHLNENTNEIVGISHSILDKFSEFGMNEKLNTHVIYNSVEEVSPTSDSKKTAKPRFGFMGSIIASKGVEQLLELFTDKDLENYDFEVLVAGRGDEEYISNLKLKYPSRRINFVGYQDSNQFYQHIDALVVPSQWEEPFGRIVIEGASYGLPIFVTKYGALKELKSMLKDLKWFNKTNILAFLTDFKGERYQYDLDQFTNTYMART